MYSISLALKLFEWRKVLGVFGSLYAAESKGKAKNYKRMKTMFLWAQLSLWKSFKTPGHGCKRKTDSRLSRRIVRMVDKKTKEKKPKQIPIDFEDQGTTLSSCTIHFCLTESGIFGRRPRKTPSHAQKSQTRVC